jgi:hypothetical protein
MGAARIISRGEGVHTRLTRLRIFLQMALGAVTLKQRWRHKLLAFILAYLPYFEKKKSKKYAYVMTMLSVCKSPYQLLNARIHL